MLTFIQKSIVAALVALFMTIIMAWGAAWAIAPFWLIFTVFL